MRLLLFFIAALVAAAPMLAAKPLPPASLVTVAPVSGAESPAPAAELGTSDAIVLGLVEGITEFLPVSSTGHLIVATHFLKLDAETPLAGKTGRPLWYKNPSPKNPAGEPLTLKLAADTYTVVIQFGAIAAVGILYWPRLLKIFAGLLGRDAAGLRLLRNLLIAFFPAAVVGLLFNKWIDQHLFSIGAVVAAQLSGAVLMFAAERWRRRQALTALDPADLPPGNALGIGLMQCAALWPGMSRSMTTIVGGYFAGLDARCSAEFSFLLGFVTLTAATVYKGWQTGPAMIQVFGWPHVLLGCVVATVAAALAVKFFVAYLTKHGLELFAYYRIAFAIVLTALFLV